MSDSARREFTRLTASHLSRGIEVTFSISLYVAGLV